MCAPCHGVVVKVEETQKDSHQLNFLRDLYVGLILARKKYSELRDFLGNYIIIKSNAGPFVLMAHLKYGSVKIKEKEVVQPGKFIAQVGNSGNTILPHLHLHLMSENNPSYSPPLTFLMAEFQVRYQGQWHLKVNSLPKNFTTFLV